MAIKWSFFHEVTGLYRWEVRGEEGPIATSGSRFESIEDCVADARIRGFRGPAAPPVSVESPAGTREPRTAKSSAR